MIPLFLALISDPVTQCQPILRNLNRTVHYQQAKTEVIKLAEILKTDPDISDSLYVWNQVMESLNELNISHAQQMELIRILGLLK